jgi:hypothetical protein
MCLWASVRYLFLPAFSFAPQFLTVGGKVVVTTSVTQAAASRLLAYVTI